MPSSETTYYNVKRLHVVFAVASLALFAVTAWMIAADHWREWKVYQRTFRDRVEPWLSDAWVREQKTEEFVTEERELDEALAEARKAVPDRGLIRGFCELIERGASREGAEPGEVASIEAAYEALAAGPGVEARAKLLGRLSRPLAAARNRRENLDRQLRFRRAELDEARSFYEAGVGEGFSEEKLNELQSRVDRVKREIDALAVRFEETSDHYEKLRGLLSHITQPEDDVRRALAEHRAKVDRLDRALAEQRPSLAKRVLGAPIIDAFGRPLAIDQIWLPELTLDYNFRRVARFDRCATCHQGIDKTAPGSSSEPACLGHEVVALELAVPEASGNATTSETGGEEPDGRSAKAGRKSESTLKSLYGLALAPRGILDADEPTVGLVLARTPAADAGLLAGDVILTIDGTKIDGRTDARRVLLEAARPSAREEEEGPRGLKLDIRRGLSQPYCSHPRLDLFVGSLSPHPLSQFGCTICHGGQGSATEFKFASHTPNDPEERIRWRTEHEWFRNEHWDFPMLPERFFESSCLRCHHAVTDLAASDRFPDPPAPKLLAGYDLVRLNGCFGCHEIKGIGPSGERVGPDMRLEPKYHEAARELLVSADLSDAEQSLAEKIVADPEDPEPRRRLVASLAVDGGPDAASDAGQGSSAALARALNVLAAEEPVPGTMRKVGPSLREVAGKLDAAFVDDWLRNPSQLRPDTRMPQIYGLTHALDGETLGEVQRFEAAEVYAVAEYLLAASRRVEPLASPPEVTEAPSAERGKRLFLTQGCAACHKHDDFPEAQSVHGPNLSKLSAKLSTERGRTWLVSWIRDPARYSSRTLMPNTLLEPVSLVEENGDGTGEAAPESITDPAADVAAYLLESADAGKKPGARRPLVESDLDELVLLHLAGAISTKRARDYLSGAVELTAESAQGDAIELLGRVTREKKIRYLGRRTIRKRGCFGCHAIPGFEDAKPIGPALSDWGRKQESLLAFEQVHRFLAESSGRRAKKRAAAKGSATSEEARADEQRDHDFYVEALLAHRREGFIWQKLRGPRSFDYKKAENKAYNEHLTMGRFTLAPAEREAIITFVLGLVADPPAEKYVYQPDRRRRAIVEGRKVLDRYACAECHTLDMERWQIRYDPEEIEEPYEVEDFAFLAPQLDGDRLAASTKPDRRGLYHAEAVGLPQRDEWGEVLEDVDDDDNPMYYLNLWEPLPIRCADRWMPWRVGSAQLGVSDPLEVFAGSPGGGTAGALTVDQQQMRPTYSPHLARIRPAWGGAFARLLLPHVLDKDNPAVMEAWGWVPPPLVDEGAKVQPAWLHDYLLEPVPIRPAAVLRMPKYTMSPDEAGKLVDYFAAAAGVDFPYTSDPRARSTHLEAEERRRPNRLHDAMRVVIDRTTFCAKCHLVGDYSPGGEIATVLGPRLDRAGKRLRPAYLRRWLANPKSLLPYTGMPVNFPPTGPPMGQDLLEGESIEQLDAVMDLLLNYDGYMNRRTSIREMIGAAQKAGSAATADEE